MSINFLDTETVGLHGIAVTIQLGNHIHHVWLNTRRSTLELIERICDSEVVAFNLTFDWFHLVKLYNLLINYDRDTLNPNEIYALEERLVRSGRHGDYALVPRAACDLFLHARVGPFQSLMVTEKDNVRIKSIPRSSAPEFIKLLPQPLRDIPAIFFHRDRVPQWRVVEATNGKPDFCDLRLSFKPSMGLKPLVAYVLGEKVIDFPLPDHLRLPDRKLGWKPWGNGWLHYLVDNVKYWSTDYTAQKYALNDTKYLEQLYNHWKPPMNDVNSQLAICTANVRWRGFPVDHVKLQKRLEQLKKAKEGVPTAPREAYRFITDGDPFVAAALEGTNEKEHLRPFIKGSKNERAVQRAKTVIDARHADKRIDFLRKLEQSIHFFPAFKIVGTKTNRMAGTGGLNPQGISHDPSDREIFLLHRDGLELSGGDYGGFEVTIADAAYNDSALHSDLQSGKSFHGLFGSALYDLPYDEVLRTKELDGEANIYNPAKNAGFAWMYGGESFRIAITARTSEEKAKEGMRRLGERYTKVKAKREEIKNRFCSISQPGGIGTPVIWADPDDKIESLLGHPRYYTMENFILKSLFDIEVPSEWNDDRYYVRRERSQTKSGCIRSALYAACFSLQQRNMRTACNHVIQATGAEICKNLQADLWRLQPQGCHKFRIAPINVHDEVNCEHLPDMREEIADVITKHVAEYRKHVPLLTLEWTWDAENWAVLK